MLAGVPVPARLAWGYRGRLCIKKEKNKTKIKSSQEGLGVGVDSFTGKSAIQA